MKALLLVVICTAILLAGCAGGGTSSGDGGGAQGNMDAKTACIQLCQAMKTAGADYSDGPCLSDEIVPDWVCDVAHSPRTAADNVPENQCSEYGKSAHHFVELDTKCNFIRQE